jgi:hypothetical protein
LKNVPSFTCMLVCVCGLLGKGQELCDAWTRLNMPRDVQWSPKWRDSENDYFPAIVHQKNQDCWLAAHNHMAGHDPERPFAWMIMALLPFLPDDVHKLIAGEGGLLCFDGGEYLALQRQEFWKRDWPSQSITLICNPLLVGQRSEPYCGSQVKLIISSLEL